MKPFLLNFDPNLSVFKSLDRGYVLQPTIRVVSIMSMSPEQDLRGQVDKTLPFAFRTIGGVYQDKTLEVKGMPDFSSDETFLIFLKKQGENYSLVRGEMGKISISGTRPTVTEKSK